MEKNLGIRMWEESTCLKFRENLQAPDTIRYMVVLADPDYFLKCLLVFSWREATPVSRSTLAGMAVFR
jgi:hypothetical protein